nr:uncharacterized protein LOC116286080 [Vicugna pacos]
MAGDYVSVSVTGPTDPVTQSQRHDPCCEEVQHRSCALSGHIEPLLVHRASLSLQNRFSELSGELSRRGQRRGPDRGWAHGDKAEAEREGGWAASQPGGGLRFRTDRLTSPTSVGEKGVWAVTQKAPARSRAPGGGVRPGARRAAGQVGRLPRGRAGSWGCRHSRRARLAERVAGASGPPSDAAAAAAVTASVACARARFWTVEDSGGAQGSRRGERGTRRGGPGARGRWSLELRFSRALVELGWRLGRGEALSAAQPSPRMPPEAVARGSWSRARAARAPLECTCVRARPSCTPTPHSPRTGPSQDQGRAPSLSPEVVSATPGPLGGGEGAVAGQMLGRFCEDPRAWGACSWKGSGRTKQSGLVGRCSGGGGPQSRLRWGRGAPHGFGKSREIGKT